MAERVDQKKLVADFKPNPEMESLVRRIAALCTKLGAEWKSGTPAAAKMKDELHELIHTNSAELQEYLRPYFKKNFWDPSEGAGEQHRWVVASYMKILASS